MWIPLKFFFRSFVLSDCQLTIVRTTGVLTRISFYFPNLTASGRTKKGKIDE